METFKPKMSGILFLLAFSMLFGCKNQEVYEPQTHMVEIIEMKFHPEELKVHKGDTVVWINKDLVSHDVTEVNKAWASPALANGDTWKKEIPRTKTTFVVST